MIVWKTNSTEMGFFFFSTLEVNYPVITCLHYLTVISIFITFTDQLIHGTFSGEEVSSFPSYSHYYNRNFFIYFLRIVITMAIELSTMFVEMSGLSHSISSLHQEPLYAFKISSESFLKTRTCVKQRRLA